MRLIRLSDNAHALETAAGALLFSYEGIAAVRLGAAGYGAAVFRLPGGPLSTATRAHLRRFSPAATPRALNPAAFADLVGRVLAGDG